MTHKVFFDVKCWSRLRTGYLLVLLPLLVAQAQAQAQEQESYGESDAPVVAVARGVQIRTNNPDEMAYVIKQILLKHYVEEKGLQATDKEIAQLLKKKQETMQGDRKKMEARRAEIQKEMASATLEDAGRKQLEKELDSIDMMDKAMSDAESRAGTPEFAEAETRIAEAFILQWKINQSLYRQYGGRVIYQQGGPEPLDAYRKFLEAAQQSGDFSISKKDFESALWNYYTTDNIHKFFPESGNEKDQAINTPWWLMEKKTGQ
jgi:hypothetical protein